jgi:hypothetical protein
MGTRLGRTASLLTWKVMDSIGVDHYGDRHVVEMQIYVNPSVPSKLGRVLEIRCINGGIVALWDFQMDNMSSFRTEAIGGQLCDTYGPEARS